MTAKHDLAGAASRRTVDWHAIEWREAHRNVRRLQARIVKAEQEGKAGKVQALQHLLTHSFSGRALAVKRVTENRGKRTPGVDGVVWNTPRRKRRPCNRRDSEAISPNRCGGCTFRKATDAGGRSAFPSWPTARCKPCTCSRLNRLPRPGPTRTRMGFAYSAHPPMLSNNASTSSPHDTQRSGS